MTIVSSIVQGVSGGGGGGTDTSDATALQHHIKTGKTAYIASGKVTGNAYNPAMMKYDGSTGYYYHTTITTSGNKCTMVLTFASGQSTGGGSKSLAAVRGPAPSYNRITIRAVDSDNAATDTRNHIFAATQNSAGTFIARLFAPATFLDGARHTLLFAFDGDAGTAVLAVDGVTYDEFVSIRIAPTTATLSAGANSSCGVGALSDGTAKIAAGAQVGFFGYKDSYLPTYSDFMRSDGSPIAQTESGSWGGWGAQPLLWNEHGQMDNNLGSAGNMTRNGTIVVGKGGNT